MTLNNIKSILSGRLHPGELILIAGRPGMGKTSLAFSIAAEAAKKCPGRETV